MSEITKQTKQIKSKLVEYLVEFTKNSDLREVTDATLMSECGLDSLAIFDFVLGLEQEFGFSIDDASFNIANFETIGSIVNFLVSYEGGAPPAQ